MAALATEAGWISGAAYAGYMAGVPLLVSLTDRVDARRIVVTFALSPVSSSLGFALLAAGPWSALAFSVLNGLALAGTYMPGLKALTDRIEARRLSRYQSLYTATFSVGTSLSLLQAGLVPNGWLGWPAAFAAAGIAPLLAAALIAWRLRPLARARRSGPSRSCSISASCCAIARPWATSSATVRTLLGAFRLSHLAGRLHGFAATRRRRSARPRSASGRRRF